MKTIGSAFGSACSLFGIAVFITTITCSAAAWGGIVTFQDPTFNNADWTATKVVDTSAGAVESFSASQSASSGNPGSYRQVTQSFFALGDLRIADVFRPGVNVYNPSVQGSISEIDYGYDLISFSTVGPTRYSPLLVQNGSYYGLAAQDSINQNAWQHFGKAGLSAADFSNLASLGSGGTHPDFSASGAPIQVGFLSLDTVLIFSDPFTVTSGIDNFSLTIRVPEPSSIVLAAVAAIAAGAAILCRRKRPMRLPALGMILAMALFMTPPASAIGGVLVPGNAGGQFGSPVSGSVDLVEVFQFSTTNQQILITATGQVQNPDPTGPDGETTQRGFIIGPFGSAYTPLEEAILDSGGVVPTMDSSSTVVHLSALIGAFIPESRAGAPGFAPRDAHVAPINNGIQSTELFLIGAGPFHFTSPGPGRLFLGINEPYLSNNSGSFDITVTPAPEPSSFLLAAVAGCTVLLVGRCRRRR